MVPFFSRTPVDEVRARSAVVSPGHPFSNLFPYAYRDRQPVAVRFPELTVVDSRLDRVLSIKDRVHARFILRVHLALQREQRRHQVRLD
jgi:hypothetical protein